MTEEVTLSEGISEADEGKVRASVREGRGEACKVTTRDKASIIQYKTIIRKTFAITIYENK